MSDAAPPARDLAYVSESVIIYCFPPSEHVGVERDATGVGLKAGLNDSLSVTWMSTALVSMTIWASLGADWNVDVREAMEKEVPGGKDEKS